MGASLGVDPGAPPLLGRVYPVDRVFSDGFETTTLERWSEGVTDSGDLSVATAAALFGGHRLEAPLDDNTPIYLTDWSPFAERRYRARFYFDPNSISMAPGESHTCSTPTSAIRPWVPCASSWAAPPATRTASTPPPTMPPV